MKDEIKEILNEIGYYQHIHENLTLSPKELDILKDYITNLQEENKEFHKKWKGTNVIIRNNKKLVMNRNTFDYLIELERNKEKAIEYINNLRDESAERQGFYNCFPDDLYIANIEDLIKLLQGSDKE